MRLPDVNVLVYAFRRDTPDHARYRELLLELVEGPGAFAVADLVLSGFVRVVTHRRVFARPSRLDDALEFANAIRGAPAATVVRPGERHWDIFASLCRAAGARGNLVPDAFLAALAIEAGCELWSSDRDFTRFPGLRYRHPLG